MKNRFRWVMPTVCILLLILPITMLTVSLLAERSSDYAASDYFAMTDAVGREVTYAPSDPVFSAAVLAFRGAKIAGAEADITSAHEPLLLEWVKDGAARRYELAFAFDPFVAVLTSEQGEKMLLDTASALFFLSTEAGAYALVGEDVPALCSNEDTYAYYCIEWVRKITTDAGVRTLSSGEYYTNASRTAEIDPSTFSPAFEVTPTKIEYSVFAGDLLVKKSSDLPSFASLPTGEYQLIAVASWEGETLTARAAYSMSFTLA